MIPNTFTENLVGSFSTALAADTLNLLANHYQLLSPANNSIAKEISIDLMYLFLAHYNDEASSTSNVTYAIGRTLRYTSLLQANHASLFGRAIGLVCNVNKKGWRGAAHSAFSFAGSKLGYFAHAKVLEGIDHAIETIRFCVE